VANGGITVDGANSGEWTTNNAIALDMANDDPRSLGEQLDHARGAHRPDPRVGGLGRHLPLPGLAVRGRHRHPGPGQRGRAGGGKISSNDGILQWLVLDTKPGAAGATNDVWNKKNSWAGVDKPDYQIYLAGSLWQGYISRATNNVFAGGRRRRELQDGRRGGHHGRQGQPVRGGAACGVWVMRQPVRGRRAESELPGRGPQRSTRDSFYEARAAGLSWA
jgi:hypothetical protein